MDLLPLDSEVSVLLSTMFTKGSFMAAAGHALEIHDGSPHPYNDPQTFPLVFTSASGIASGAALARVAQVMANGGSLAVNGNVVRLLSAQTYERMHQCGEKVWDAALGVHIAMTPMGTGCDMYPERIAGGYVGWGGWGGSVCLWNRRENVAMGYAMNRMGLHLFNDPRIEALSQAVHTALV